MSDVKEVAGRIEEESAFLRDIIREVEGVIVGQRSLIHGMLIGLLADGHVDGPNLVCGLHGWDYRLDTGVSEYNNSEFLHKFRAWVDHEADADAAEMEALELRVLAAQGIADPYGADDRNC